MQQIKWLCMVLLKNSCFFVKNSETSVQLLKCIGVEKNKFFMPISNQDIVQCHTLYSIIDGNRN